ncbi:MAG: hypothetical protein Q9160_007275 [Pyrenula sp. 1 TL-2023]
MKHVRSIKDTLRSSFGRDVGRKPEHTTADPRPIDVPTTFSPDKQIESPLFTRLPSEIRLQIFKHVLGDEHVYNIIETRTDTGLRLAHLHCPHEPFASACCSQNPCNVNAYDLDLCSRGRGTISIIRNGREVRKPMYHDSQKVSYANLALLRACRQAYSEARLMPYSHNTFRFSSLEIFVNFSQSIPPASLASLHRIHASRDICWPPLKDRTPNAAQSLAVSGDRLYLHGVEIYDSPSDEAWLAFWALVASKIRMPRLEEVCIELAILDGYRQTVLKQAFGDEKGLDMNLEAPWLQPILSVRGLRQFEMRIVESSLPRKSRKEFFDEIRAIVCEPGSA